MESNINNKKQFSFMKKLMLIFLFVFGVSSVMGGTLINPNDSDYAINQYLNNDISSKYNYVVFGNDDFSYTINNITYTYDFRQYLNEVKAPIYIIFDNFELNSTYNIFLTDVSNSVGGVANTLNYTIVTEEIGTYYFELQPKFLGQNMILEMNFPNSYSGEIYLANSLEKEQISLFTPLINGVVDLILINVGIWKIAYYLFIVVIIVGGLFGIVLLAYRFYQWANKLDIWGKKKNRSNFRK